jgi:hypothetical protein
MHRVMHIQTGNIEYLENVLIAMSSDRYPVSVNLCRKCRCRTRNVAKYAMYWLCDDGNP